jgi:hypothetical protein
MTGSRHTRRSQQDVPVRLHKLQAAGAKGVDQHLGDCHSRGDQREVTACRCCKQFTQLGVRARDGLR